MRKEQIEQYRFLDKLFNEECERVVNILKDYAVYTDKHETSNIRYASEFSLNDTDVDWEGDEYWNYGGHEYHDGDFPVSYLSMTDEEIRTIAEKENKDYLEECRKKAERKKKAQDAADYEQYKRLKEKFGD